MADIDVCIGPRDGVLSVPSPDSATFAIDPSIRLVDFGFDGDLVVAARQVGGDLVVDLTNGEAIRLVGFYSVCAEPPGLEFGSDSGNLGLLLAGLGIVGVAAAAGGGGDDDDGEDVGQMMGDGIPPDPPTIDAIEENPNGTITVSGFADPGNEVTVTFPSGEEIVVFVDDGPDIGPKLPLLFEATSTVDQETGEIIVVSRDADGDLSEVVTSVFIATPEADSEVNPDGSITTSGIADPSLQITVTFPDGSTANAFSDIATGEFSITSGPNQPAGDIVTVASDDADNTSGQDVDAFMPANGDAVANGRSLVDDGDQQLDFSSVDTADDPDELDAVAGAASETNLTLEDVGLVSAGADATDTAIFPGEEAARTESSAAEASSMADIGAVGLVDAEPAQPDGSDIPVA